MKKNKIEIPKEIIEPIETGFDTLISEYVKSQPQSKAGKIIRLIANIIPTKIIVSMLLHKIEKK